MSSSLLVLPHIPSRPPFSVTVAQPQASLSPLGWSSSLQLPLCNPCCQTFLPKLRFSHTRFMLGHKTQPCLASPPGLVSIVVVSLCAARPLLETPRAPGAGSRGQEPLQEDCPPQEGGKQGAARAQFLLPKAPSVWGAVSPGGEQRPAVTVTTTVTNHVITISCHVETWSREGGFPAP